ncbi:MAG: CHAT domain-containing protein, partial [Chloroflexota bacterium]
MDAPELQDVPWERLRDPNTELTLSASSKTPFSRYLAGDFETTRSLAVRPLRMLVVIANPDGLLDYPALIPINVALERSIIEQAMVSIDNDLVELVFLPPPVTLVELTKALTKGVDLLHIVAHGTVTKQRSSIKLFLANESNQVDLVDSHALTQMIGHLNRPPHLIFFASCQTASQIAVEGFRGLAPELVVAGVPAILAMQGNVAMQTARVFAQTFYRYLFKHGQVDLASNQARATLLSGNLPDVDIPVLFSHLKDNQLVSFPKLSLPKNALQDIPFQVPSIDRTLVGRDEDLDWLIEQARQTNQGGHVVGVYGLGGVGKSYLVQDVAHRLRDHFKDGVLWAEFDRQKPISAVLDKFGRALGKGDEVSQESDIESKAPIVWGVLRHKHALVILENVENIKDISDLKWLIPNGPNNITILTTRDQQTLEGLSREAIRAIRSFSTQASLRLLANIIGDDAIAKNVEIYEDIANAVEGLPLALNIIGAGHLRDITDRNRLERYRDLLLNEQKRLKRLKRQNSGVSATFEITYQALDQNIYPMRQILATLSIFEGRNFDAEAAAAITEIEIDDLEFDVIHRLKALSLLEEETILLSTSSGEVIAQIRFRMHALLKLFAMEKLQEDYADQIEGINHRAANYFADFSDQHAFDGYDLLEPELENIVGTLHWAKDHNQWPLLNKGIQGLTQLHLGVIGFLDARGYWGQARK